MGAETERQSVQRGEQRWLIRSVANRITGPFSLQQIREMIEQGKLQLGDEVCNANSYWFYLHEAGEVRAQLGIEIPRKLYASRPEESTDTQTDTTDLDSQDSPSQTRMVSPKESRELPESPEPSFEDVGENSAVENTAVMSSRTFRDLRQKNAEPPRRPPLEAAPAPRRVGIERSKLLSILAYIMMAGAVVLVIAVLRLLRQPPG